MTLEFFYDENYMRTYIPEQLKTEVFDFYFGGFAEYKGKIMVLLRRHPSETEGKQRKQIQILYNGKKKTIAEPLRMHVEGVLIEDYFMTDSWKVIIVEPSVKLNGIPIEAIIPGRDFSEEELYGLYELENSSAYFSDLLGDLAMEQGLKTNLGKIYIRLLDTLHRHKNRAYQTKSGVYEAVGERVFLEDENSYCEKVSCQGFLSEDRQAWICKCPAGQWKKNRKTFMEIAKDIPSNARGRIIDVKMIFDKKYLLPDAAYEYRMFRTGKK